MNLNNNKFSEPPQSDDFGVLFAYAYERGLGLSDADSSGSWTVGDLENAFETLGKTVTDRSIQNWLSGRKPRPENIHALAQIFSGGNRSLKESWLNAFLASSTRKRKTTIAPDLNDIATPHAPSHAFTQNPLFLVSAGFLFAIILGLAAQFLSASKTAISVDNIRFCAKPNFDDATKRCSYHQGQFPEGTELVYVSFDMSGLEEGQPFKRLWYRDGRQFLEKDSFYDEAWEGWTWLGEPDGHETGLYHLRIVVNDRAFTETFTIGEVTGDETTTLPEPF